MKKSRAKNEMHNEIDYRLRPERGKGRRDVKGLVVFRDSCWLGLSVGAVSGRQTMAGLTLAKLQSSDSRARFV